MYEHKPARFRRLIAFLIDFHATIFWGFFVVFAGMLLLPFGMIYFAMVCCVFCAGSLYVRDWLLGGRSIGKRACGLSVVDRATGRPATGKQLLIKDLCCMVLPFDGLVLLLTGRSIGERISCTAVIQEKLPAPLVKKRFVKFAAVTVVLGLLMGFTASYGVDQSKKNESYALAQTYLIESETFAAREKEGIRPTLTVFASKTVNGQTTHQYTFDTRIHYYVVTCHLQEDGTWAVCDECTDFD